MKAFKIHACLVISFLFVEATSAFAAGTLPAGYTEVEYIQGNGSNARILTNYTPKPNINKIEAVVEWPTGTLNAHQAVWCSRGNGTQADSWTLFYINDNKKFRYDYMPNGHAVSLTPNFTISTGTKYTITAENNTVTYSVNGSVLETQSTPEYSYTAGSVLALFASHYSGINANVGNYGKQKLYSFKVWRSDELIHYFVPCKDSNGAATLVDICESPATMTKNGTFDAGPEGHFYDDSAFGSLTILPIPNQLCLAGAEPEPGFTVTNRDTGAFWVFAEGAVAPEGCPFEASYSFDNGVGTVTVTGKTGGEYDGETLTRSYFFIDDFLVNGGFESGTLVPGWTGTATIGNASSGYGPNHSTVFISGTYCALLTKSQSATQVFKVESECRANLSWKFKHRSNYNANTPVYCTVLLDGEVIHPEEKLTGSSVFSRNISDIFLQPGEHTLTFQGRTDNNADQTFFLDDVALRMMTPMVILPIPDQNYYFGGIYRPTIVVSNIFSAATWTIGGDTVSEDFDVEYANNAGAGVALVKVSGKGTHAGECASTTFNISSSAATLEDENLSTTDIATRRLVVDGKYVYIFTNAASAASVTLKRNLVLTDALLVGGGGAGGNTMAGGGGAGGFIELAGVYAGYDVGDEITFTVGAGGAVATGQNRGGRGGDTVLTLDGTTHTAKGGGGGGGWSSAVGASGGSGGGSTRGSSVGLGVEGQGHAGARAANGATSSTGGGGGAGESGHGPTTSPARSGDGGAGRLFAITGEYYGGGGGGGGSVIDYGTALAGSGGLGGGGDGGRDTGGANGADGYGGGGGGGGWTNANQFGGKGGSGTVILAFRQTDLGINAIPDQSLDEGGVCRPSFTVVNMRTSQSWTVGGDSESPNFDVEYTNNTAIGVAGVTLIGKGVYAGERFYTTFRIISDSNIATDDLTVRTFTTGGRTVYVFKNAALGRTTVTARRGLFLADALLVGGGGAGGNTMGAGGGGGGVLQLNGVNAVYKPNDTFSLTVGAGGVISATPGYRGTSGSKTSLEFGVSSGMNAVIVAGGGAGGAWSNNSGLKGASGGGGCKTAAGGAGTDGLGYAGAAGIGDGKSGGGGGAGQVGSSADTAAKVAGAGGNGVLSSITGEDVYYGGGGGAGGSDRDYGTYAPGTGGLGGGGKGGKELHGANGVDGLGGGGGGGGYNGVIQANGGNGGAGTVILSFAAADLAIDSVPSQVLAAGSACPEPVVRLAGDSTVLTKGVDYEVSYSGNDALGTALMTVTGIGTYAGKVGYATFLVVERYYAKPSVDEEGDGLSWATAMSVTNFFAKYGIVNNPCEVWIASGTVAAQTISITNNASLIIRGGFAGTETSLDERPEGAITVFDGENTAKCLLKALTGENAELTLDQIKFYRAKENGFIKTGGGSLQILGCVVEANGRDVGTVYGRGMNVQSDGRGSLVLKDSVFAGNRNVSSGDNYGGFGIYIVDFGNALVDNSLFVTNGFDILTPEGSVYGKWGWCGNNAKGSSIYANNTPITVSNCRFAGNNCPLNAGTGGVVYLAGASGGSVIDHCTFIGNSEHLSYQAQGSGLFGGAGALVVNLANATDKVSVNHCTFAYNLTCAGYSAGGISVVKGDVDIDNSIFWKNIRYNTTTIGYGLDVHVSSSGTANIRHSTVTDLNGTALGGAGLTYDPQTVFAADPKLVTTTEAFTNLLKVTSSRVYYNPNNATRYEDLASMDAHLLSPTGYVDNAGVFHDGGSAYSPAIDAGDPEADCSNEPEPNGGRLNAGAFGNTAEASSSATGQPEANVEVLYLNDEPRPVIRITMGLESGDAYNATVRLNCSVDGMPVVDEMIFYGVGNGAIIEQKLPLYLPVGTECQASVTITAAGAEIRYYDVSEPATGTPPPFFGKGGGASVIHVRTGADFKMDGTSWTDAYPDLLTALKSAPDEGITEIWLAVTNDFMNRTVTLGYPLTIRGGFTGVENSPAERPEGRRANINGNYVYTTMSFEVPEGALLEVERIHFLKASQNELRKTGKGDLLVRDCIFAEHWSDSRISGRGIYASGGGTVAVTNCTFARLGGPTELSNTTDGGDAIYLSSCVRAYIDNCLFVTNGAPFSVPLSPWGRHKAASIYANSTPTIISNCRFSACCAAQRHATDGGIVCFTGNSGGSKIVNCALVGNGDFLSYDGGNAGASGGAIACEMSAADLTLDIENCTIAYNLTDGYKSAAGINVYSGTVNLKNSIIYGNVRGRENNFLAGADIDVKAGATLNISYSLVTGTTTNYIGNAGGEGIINWGAGILTDDPLFPMTTNDFVSLLATASSIKYIPSSASPTVAALDVHPRTRTGYIKDGVLIRDPERVESPTIDAGDPDSDYSNEPNILHIGGNGKRVNMGAYGNTPEAALTRIMGLRVVVR